MCVSVCLLSSWSSYGGVVTNNNKISYSPFLKQALVFMCLQYNSFENNVGKGEIACNKQFLLFPVFSTRLKNFLSSSQIWNCLLRALSVWKSLKLFVWERVNTYHMKKLLQSNSVVRTIDWMVFYAAFNSIWVIQQQQLTLFMSFLGFTSTRLGLWSVLPKDTPPKKPRWSSAAQTQCPWIMCQTLYHWATQDLFGSSNASATR